MSTRIAIASGKGGTGKTLVSTNLASVMDRALLVDLDVEEPNCHLFVRGDSESVTPAFRPVPQIDGLMCNMCGKCGQICEYHAIAVVPTKVLVFEELCHGCGACTLLCPAAAISERQRPMGEIVRVCNGGETELLYGRLMVKEPSATPLIRQVKREIPRDCVSIVDCPPGTACTAVESIRDADLCIMVTEPTPFGLHDLKLSLDVASKLRVPTAVFVNKLGLRGPDIKAFCAERGIPVLGCLPYERNIAQMYSRGKLITGSKGYRQTFEELADRIAKGGGPS